MNSPTLTGAHGTQIGVILGTAAYMAPEQAAGGTVDRRADVWAFGVVLYEMVTGRRLFDGETTSHVLAGVLKDEPDFSALPPATPRRIEDLLRRCLRKKPRERLQAIGDARLAIEDVLAEPQREERIATAVVGHAASRRAVLPWALAGVGLAAATLFAVLWTRAPLPAAPPSVLEVSLVPPSETRFTDNFALSPDGRRVVFETYDIKTGAQALWLRELDRDSPRRLEAAATGGTNPFWSPDSSQIAFFDDGKLKRLDPRGGPAHTLAEAPTPRGGAWAADGSIIFAPSFRTGLSLVPAAGGGARELTTLDDSRNEKSHRFPVVLPDGKTVLFVAQTAEAGARDDDSSIEVLDLPSGKRTRLITANSAPLFAPPRTLLYWREGSLLAQRLDLERWAVVGDPEPIASPVAFTQNEQPLASISGEGMLVYRGGTRGTFSSFVLLDRSGIGVKVLRDRELFSDFALSDDGKRLAYSVNALGQGSTDIWIYDLDRDAASRLTFEEGSESYPAWSRDGRQLYYANDRRNDGVIFRRPADGAGAAEEVATTAAGIWPLAASPDGAWLAVGAVGSETKLDILRLDLATGEKTPLATTPFDDQGTELSPDGSLLAYCSDQAGRWEVYVQALSGARGRWQVSSEGGVDPHWRGDGRELYFMIPPDRHDGCRSRARRRAEVFRAARALPRADPGLRRRARRPALRRLALRRRGRIPATDLGQQLDPAASRARSEVAAGGRAPAREAPR